MNKHFKFCFLIFTVAFSSSILAQYVGRYTEKNRIIFDTLLDKLTSNKFIVDTSRTYITAIDQQGKILWRTNPILDNKLEKYQTDKPTIIHFAFNNNPTKTKEVIWISYSNTQFGYIDKGSGKFTFRGQD